MQASGNYSDNIAMSLADECELVAEGPRGGQDLGFVGTGSGGSVVFATIEMAILQGTLRRSGPRVVADHGLPAPAEAAFLHGRVCAMLIVRVRGSDHRLHRGPL
jgi:hypothetical protein